MEQNIAIKQNEIDYSRFFKLLALIILVAIIIIGVVILILGLTILKKDKFEFPGFKPIPIIMDVDEGGDDMVSYLILKNSKKYNILGLTTMSPAYYISNVTDIWLRFLDYMGFEEKIYSGENHPLVRKTNPVEFQHSYGDIVFPLTNKVGESKSGVDFMIDTIKNSREKITLFLLGPLTNFAVAYQKDNTIINNIKEIIIMGGAKYDGNMEENPKAEYNIFMDAEAANVVFNCGIKPKVFGTTVTHQVIFTEDIYERYKNMGTHSSHFLYESMRGTFITWQSNYLHDPSTALYHLNNSIFELKNYYAYVNTTKPDDNPTEYATIYFLEPNETHKANIQYAEKINLSMYFENLDYYMKKY